MLGACWQVPVSGSGRSLQGRLLASVPVVSPLEPGMKVAGPPGLLGGEEGSRDGVPQAAGVGLQEDGGPSQELQEPRGQGGGPERAPGGQQRAARGGEAELPLQGLVGRVEGFLQRRLVEEEGDEVQGGVDGLQKEKKRPSQPTDARPGRALPPTTCRFQGPLDFPCPLLQNGHRSNLCLQGLRRIIGDRESEIGFLPNKKHRTKAIFIISL